MKPWTKPAEESRGIPGLCLENGQPVKVSAAEHDQYVFIALALNAEMLMREVKDHEDIFIREDAQCLPPLKP